MCAIDVPRSPIQNIFGGGPPLYFVEGSTVSVMRRVTIV